jgi:fumarylacetoacetate (FAA) hydrolase
MKLASMKHGRDGRLAIVSRDLSHAVLVPDIAATLQQALDDWLAVEPQLRRVSQALEAGGLDGAVAFDPCACAAPLPRAYQWADGSAYVNHVELVRRARGAEMPASFWHEPLIYQGGSDDFIGGRDDIPLLSDAWGIDFEGEIAVITDDVPMGTTADRAAGHVKLLMLVNDVSLRGLIPGELEKGFGFYQSKPASSCSPVAVTPDELGEAWRDAKVHGALLTHFNGQPFGKPDAGVDMTFSFADLVAHAARTRNLGAGSIIGSGTVSNRQGAGYGSAIAQGGVGYSCIAELRMIETIRDGAPATPFMAFGDRVRMEMLDAQGRSIFGAIDQAVSDLRDLAGTTSLLGP